MPEKKQPPEKKKPKGIGDEIAGGLLALKYPGYAAHVREARAMGEEPMTPEEWARHNKDDDE